MFGLGHIDMMPLIAGCIYALGMWSVWHKWLNGRYLGAIVELAVFFVLFKMHGSTLTGGTGATIAALIVGSLFPTKRRAK